MKVLMMILSLFGPTDPLYDTEHKAFTDVYYDLESKFTYVSDTEQFGVYDSIHPEVTGDAPFKGDCEEYMFAANYQLWKRGVDSSPVFIPNHVMNCGKYWCIDTLHRGVFTKPTVQHYPKTFQ